MKLGSMNGRSSPTVTSFSSPSPPEVVSSTNDQDHKHDVTIDTNSSHIEVSVTRVSHPDMNLVLVSLPKELTSMSPQIETGL